MIRVKAAFFSFTPPAPADDDGSYLRWHLLDHMVEQYQLPGIQYALRHDLGPLEAAIARAGGRLAWSARGLPGPDEAPARRAPPLSPPPAAAS